MLLFSVQTPQHRFGGFSRYLIQSVVLAFLLCGFACSLNTQPGGADKVDPLQDSNPAHPPLPDDLAKMFGITEEAELCGPEVLDQLIELTQAFPAEDRYTEAELSYEERAQLAAILKIDTNLVNINQIVSRLSAQTAKMTTIKASRSFHGHELAEDRRAHVVQIVFVHWNTQISFKLVYAPSEGYVGLANMEISRGGENLRSLVCRPGGDKLGS